MSRSCLAKAVLATIPGKVGTLFCAVALTAVFAQNPAFDVASLHPDHNDSEPSIAFTPGRMKVQGVTLKQLILEAYRVRNFQLSGGASWIDSQRFAIEARTTPGAGADAMLLMLRALLEERFKLKVHREMKEGPVYLLSVAKNGVKLTPATCVPFDSSSLVGQMRKTDEERAAQCSGIGSIDYRSNAADHNLDSKGATLQDGVGPPFESITGQLSLVLDRPVYDKTGLDGIFEFHLRWTSDRSSEVIPPSTSSSAPADPTSPSLFTAIQEQLGLRLDSGKGPIELLVIDHIELPYEN